MSTLAALGVAMLMAPVVVVAGLGAIGGIIRGGRARLGGIAVLYVLTAIVIILIGLVR